MAADRAAFTVRVTGYDPRLAKAQQADFSQATDGKSALSTSGKPSTQLLPLSALTFCYNTSMLCASQDFQVLLSNPGSLLTPAEEAGYVLVCPATVTVPFLQQPVRTAFLESRQHELIDNTR